MATITEAQAALLRGKNFANLATIREDGTPHVTPVWVDWDGEHVLMNTAAGRAKWNHMRRDPRVGVEVFDSANPYSYVSMTGTVSLAEAGAEEHIRDLAEKYRGSREFDLRDETRVIVRFTPDRIGGNV
jgi:PPOX class probable F420-dependent enzyme